MCLENSVRMGLAGGITLPNRASWNRAIGEVSFLLAETHEDILDFSVTWGSRDGLAGLNMAAHPFLSLGWSRRGAEWARRGEGEP